MTRPKLVEKKKARGDRKLPKKFKGMSEEDEGKYREYREKQNEKIRAWRNQLSPEERDKIRAVDAARARALRAERAARRTPEEKAKKVTKKKLVEMTKEEKEERKQAVREKRNKKRRACRARMTPEEKILKRIAYSVRSQRKRAEKLEQMTSEATGKNSVGNEYELDQTTDDKKANKAVEKQNRWANMTEEEKLEKKKRLATYYRNKYHKKGGGLKMTEWVEAVAKDYNNKNVTALERINRNIVIINRKSLFTPRYRVAITLMRTAFKDMRQMYEEIDYFRVKCMKTVTKAIKSAVKKHFIAKRRNAGQKVSNTKPTIAQPGTSTESSLHPSKQNNFACLLCNKKYVTQLGLIIHQKDHDSANSFKCCTCNEEFTSYNAMNSHYIQTHLVEPPPEEIIDEELERSFRELFFLEFKKCNVCLKQFVSMQSFSAHVMTDHADDPELFKWFTFPCSMCNKHFHTRKLLTIHWNGDCFDLWKTQKTIGNTADFVCGLCGLKFTHDEHLANHRKLLHFGEPEEEGGQGVQCKDCVMSFASKADLTTHVQTVHTDRVCCEFCGKYSSNQRCLKTHQQKVHFAERKHQCTICKKRFFARADLETHVNAHNGLSKSFPCRFCDKEYSSMSARVVHELVHKGGLSCKNCGKLFLNYVELRGHKKLNCNGSNLLEDGNLDETGKETFTCKICGKTYTKYMSLYLHERDKHSQHPFKCAVCGKTFKTKYFLVDHQYSHSNIHRFGCSVCGKTFKQSTQFYDHRKKHKDVKAQLMKFPVELPPELKDAVLNTNAHFSGSAVPSQYAADNPSTVEQREALYETSSEYMGIEFPDSPEHNFDSGEAERCNDRMSNISDQLTSKVTVTIPTVVNPSATNSNPNIPEERITAAPSISPRFIDFSRANVPAASTQLAGNSLNQPGTSAEINLPDVTNSGLENQSSIPDVATKESLEIKVKMEPKNMKKESDDDDDEYMAYSDYYENDSVDCEINIKQEIDDELSMDSCPPETKKISENKKRKHPKTRNETKTKAKKSTSVKNKKTTSTDSETETAKSSKKSKQSTDGKKKRRKKISAECKTEENCTENTKKSPYTYQCKYCETVCHSIKEFDTHCIHEHHEIKCFQCDKCELAFKTSGLLYKHNARMHLGRKYKRSPRKPRDPNQEKDCCCELCGKSFYSRGLLRKHFLNVHDGRKFPCDVCGKMFNSVSNLNGHKIRHTDVRAFVCEECGRSFFTSSDLRGHVECVHKKNCRRRENRLKAKAIKSELEKLNPSPTVTKKKRIVFTEDMKGPFPCVLCPLSFSSEGGLKKHMVLHDPTRQYACDVCGLRYKFHSNVVTHKNYVHKPNVVVNQVLIP